MQNPFLFEAEYPVYESQFEDASEFYEGEDEDEIRHRRRSGGGARRSSSRASKSRPRTAPQKRRRPPKPQKPPRPRYPSSVYPSYPSSHFSGGSFSSAAASEPNSELIRLLQSLLNRVLGLNLPVDGVMSVETRSAIRSFQNQQDGAAAGKNGGSDAQTDTPTDQPSPADQPAAANGGEGDSQSEFYEYEFDFEYEDEVNRQSADYGRWIQQSLNNIMGLRLVVDGIVGSQTRSAIRSFQQRQGLTVDGIVGPITEGAMIRAGASQPPQSSASTPYTPTPSIPSGTPDIVSVRGIQVARQIASQVGALLAAAEKDGVKLSGSGYRTMQQQIQLRIANCKGNTHYHIYEKPSSQCTPPTAPPGRSNHEKGLAIDFRYNGQQIKSRTNPGFVWLSRNAAKYGLYNLPSEEWHWSVNGK